MELRNMLKSVFGREKDNPSFETSRYRLLDSYNDYFTPVNKESWNDATVRQCIDTIAKNVAKLKMRHIRRKGNRKTPVNSSLDTLLTARPNEYMTAYDFLYKITAQLYTYNNAFVYVKTDAAGNIIGLYPLNYENVEVVEHAGELYCRFTLGINRITVSYRDLIHLRRHFNNHDIYGDDNDSTLNYSVKILDVLKKSMENVVKNCNKIRGYLKINGVMRPQDQAQQRDDFISNIDKSGSGIAVLDQKLDYTPIDNDLKMADASQLDFARQDIYRYFGLNENIITSKYSEAEYIAFYESVIEPLIIQYSQEFTDKIFTEREKNHGNEIIIESNRLEYASLKDKVNLCQVLQQSGIMSINEFREIFGFAPIDGGDEIRIKADYSNKKEVKEDGEENKQD